MKNVLMFTLIMVLGLDAANAQLPQYMGAWRVGYALETEVSGTEQSDKVQLPKSSFVLTDSFELANTNWYPNRHHELSLLRFYERSDEPCAVTVVTAPGYTTAKEHGWDGCEGRRRSLKSIGENFVFESPGGAVDAYTYLKAIRVCQSTRSGERGGIVKGIEAEWVSHPSYPAASPVNFWTDRLSGKRKFQRTNCTNAGWAEWARCPEGTAALAIRLHHKALDGRRALTGISLKCHIMEGRIGDGETLEFIRRHISYEAPQPAISTQSGDDFSPLIPPGRERGDGLQDPGR